ncbi:MAG: hypothetical protein UT30_C0011G0023 [Candidatus Uhrbacteria bacterium GW2011_GWF2_39_13]|uniref:Uncharacterized protein n=1 Tax=Candidatus Uhrbacteria bacterium GW2011_GWF2_39_13 TaxID=1618995 RepID=A0A0G0QRE3_9BACT|nr:MAG: hypothetical protein UT30_C0011G0023 [Candidatus Uhrbacteria bacterium GW2011_GWF2_39_13]HAU66651.1 hypothetical protein [Candidatus Uhrbacteria bacterium]
MSEEKRFHVIRVSEDYKFVLVVYSITGKPPWDLKNSNSERPEDLTYYCCDYINKVFKPCSESAALQAFSGIADGMGHAKLPPEPFTTLEEIVAWRDDLKSKFTIEYLEHLERLSNTTSEKES